MKYSYHGVAVANPGNQLLEEEASLNNEHAQLRPRLVAMQTQNIFSFTHHIESFDACMKH
jgi:hypothetical protein